LELRRHANDLAVAHKAREGTREELDKVQAENAKLKRELAKLKKKPATGKVAKAKKRK